MVEAARPNGIPNEQWAIQVQKDGTWTVEKIKVPRPGYNQVLVKIECAPINPSDTYFMAGMYSKLDESEAGEEPKMKFPLAAGWEGAGTVVENGGGVIGWARLGKRVSVTKCQEAGGVFSIGGAYQQYMVTSAL